MQKDNRAGCSRRRAVPLVLETAAVHGDECARHVRYGRLMARQLKRTYSKSIGLLLTPERGGAIQFANLPGSTTRPLMSDCTNA